MVETIIGMVLLAGVFIYMTDYATKEVEAAPAILKTKVSFLQVLKGTAVCSVATASFFYVIMPMIKLLLR